MSVNPKLRPVEAQDGSTREYEDSVEMDKSEETKRWRGERRRNESVGEDDEFIVSSRLIPQAPIHIA